MAQSLLEQLLDENNTDNIVLADSTGKQVEFLQIAVIPFNDDLYVILKPAEKLEGLEDDEALVFLIDAENDNLIVEENENIVNGVFDNYYQLLDEQA